MTAERPDAGQNEPAADALRDQDDLYLEQARRWYARQSRAVREWPLGMDDEPDFVGAIDDDE